MQKVVDGQCEYSKWYSLVLNRSKWYHCITNIIKVPNHSTHNFRGGMCGESGWLVLGRSLGTRLSLRTSEPCFGHMRLTDPPIPPHTGGEFTNTKKKDRQVGMIANEKVS